MGAVDENSITIQSYSMRNSELPAARVFPFLVNPPSSFHGSRMTSVTMTQLPIELIVFSSFVTLLSVATLSPYL